LGSNDLAKRQAGDSTLKDDCPRITRRIACPDRPLCFVWLRANRYELTMFFDASRVPCLGS